MAKRINASKGVGLDPRIRTSYGDVARCRVCNARSEAGIGGDRYRDFIRPHFETCGKGKTYISEIIDWEPVHAL